MLLDACPVAEHGKEEFAEIHEVHFVLCSPRSRHQPARRGAIAVFNASLSKLRPTSLATYPVRGRCSTSSSRTCCTTLPVLNHDQSIGEDGGADRVMSHQKCRARVALAEFYKINN
jgi:hypothetical protein